jgi:hypothetical protein
VKPVKRSMMIESVTLMTVSAKANGAPDTA